MEKQNQTKQRRLQLHQKRAQAATDSKPNHQMASLSKLSTDLQEKQTLVSTMAAFPRGRGKIFPQIIRNRGAAWIKKRLLEGASRREVSRELNIAIGTVYRWDKLTGKSKKNASSARNKFLISVTTPRGVRVEGLSISEAIQLVRALS